MEAIRQIYDKIPATIEVPVEFRDRRVEVIIFPIDDSETPKMEDNATTVADPHGLRFAGSLPDFPDIDSEGDYETRKEWG